MLQLNFFKRTAAIVAVALLGFTVSCVNDETPLQDEASYVAEDVISDFAFEDADDLAGLALMSDDAPGGGRVSDEPRVITIDDPRCSCENLTVTITLTPNSTPEHPVGSIVIDFGEGCTDPLGNVRKGKIIVNFSGRRFLPGSSVVTTFEDYSINDIVLGGVRTLTNVSESTEAAPEFEVELEDGSATWPDGTMATREHCFVRRWVRAASPINDQLIVRQCGDADFAASGTNRRGRAYTMTIVEELVYKRGCPIAVSGIKEFTDVASGKVITVDYGDGDCDRVITISVDGQSRSFEVKRRG
ncbi:MAG: hypothetical protein L6Q51_14260 [Cyclobacteriaceae bacterium]|nr:hypothetical protein [Cyclobacteriaceae bacterium]